MGFSTGLFKLICCIRITLSSPLFQGEGSTVIFTPLILWHYSFTIVYQLFVAVNVVPVRVTGYTRNGVVAGPNNTVPAVLNSAP